MVLKSTPPECQSEAKTTRPHSSPSLISDIKMFQNRKKNYLELEGKFCHFFSLPLQLQKSKKNHKECTI